MSLNKAKMMRYTERVMKRLEVYQENKEMDENYELYYLLVKKGNDKKAIAYAVNGDEAISFNPFSENHDHSVKKYDATLLFNDNSLFNHLEERYQLIGMSLDAHFCVWTNLVESKMETNFPNGMKEYMQFCRRDGMTKEKLNEIGYDGADVLSAYKEQNKNSSELER